MRHYLILFSLIIGFTACENSTVAPNEEILGLQFFPLDFENIDRYAVEEINYNNDGTIDTSRYFLQDEWTDSIPINGGTKLEGYRYRIDQNGEKRIASTIVKTRTSQLAQVKIGNSEEVKISFPISEGENWNGIPAALEEDIFTIKQAFQSYDLADSTFENTVQIIQEDNQDSIANYDQRIEVYAANVGLIYRISSQIEFCRDTECLGLQEIEFGKTVRMMRTFE
ncbi:hypothetical protein MATR_18990 [Marivirga tractuosa]|uniref:Lipoprotein n=1 Tax=Marivirga tractuosa (strain ATCC 23168 / DSM 4126 / NBRC 15989 / NCIMB 1408 / VKM B-1430 / H-43) TaxID=643867 RepID=E4TP77_MARTH|nr:hypothetical protein [Marivirga tractuosa]ADR20480.1 hypothetical protein Ftrac_0475 [Marivirga tractuosa DSM 4126]BDD15074.1 hypothetical protein MATR_18990 [Marivirga tractuosa]